MQKRVFALQVKNTLSNNFSAAIDFQKNNFPDTIPQRDVIRNTRGNYLSDKL